MFQEHDPGSFHCESPRRLAAIDRALEAWEGLGECEELALVPATAEQLERVHSPEHIERIASTAGGAFSLDPDTQTSPRSYEVALAAAGSLAALCERVAKGEFNCGFAMVRPPGHHATAHRAMGFCLFNNVAVAAAHLLNAVGLERVMIVDWDVHHGNGTEAIFYADPRVLYFSTHQYPFYPGTGAVDDTGSGEGRGYTVNVPLAPGHDELDYLRIFTELFLPVAEQYAPQLIIVSAGFDPHMADPLGGMRVSSEGFGAMAQVVLKAAEKVCPGKVVFALEGGYAVDAQAEAVIKVLEAVRGADYSSIIERAGSQSPPPELASAISVQREYWKF